MLGFSQFITLHIFPAKKTSMVMMGDARSYWQSASNVAERMRDICGWEPGFVQMIIVYSMSDITWRLGMPTTTTKLIEKARELYARAGRQSCWFAFALWFDLVEDGLQSNGLDRISKQRYDGKAKWERISIER